MVRYRAAWVLPISGPPIRDGWVDVDHGRVVACGAGAQAWSDKAVIVPAVLPCGECDLCRRGLGTICRQQKMPGNDIQGGFASHIVVPARGLCEVNELRMERAGLTLAEVSIVADALTTPYHAVRRAGVTPGSLAIVVGAGDLALSGRLTHETGLLRPWWHSVAQWVGSASLTEQWRFHVIGGQKGWLLGHAWTLGYEEQFYAVTGLLLFLCPGRFFLGAAAVTAGVVAVAALGFALGIAVRGWARLRAGAQWRSIQRHPAV